MSFYVVWNTKTRKYQKMDYVNRAPGKRFSRLPITDDERRAVGYFDKDLPGLVRYLKKACAGKMSYKKTVFRIIKVNPWGPNEYFKFDGQDLVPVTVEQEQLIEDLYG